jgi:hypothetical protein
MMKMKNVKIQQTLNKMKFNTIKYSPQILMYSGAVGVIGAGILACRSTLKLSAILDKSKETINTIHETRDDETIEDYSPQDAKKDLAIVYTSTALDIAKLYAPAVILGGVSLAAMIQSHNILNRRNAALAAAFTTATESFNRYRKAVVDKYGEDIDKELRYGIKKEKINVVDENGKAKKETVDVVDSQLNNYSDYARFYDDGCDGWSKDPEYNLMFLKAQERFANDKLVAQGYLFLNDVYRMLGIPDSKAGQIVGWVYNPDAPEGDNYVDFGLCDVYKENVRDFVNGYERTILLDFNVDGNIWDKM